jgi:hypothetical protein
MRVGGEHVRTLDGIRVLLVEDEADNREFVTRLA